MAGQEGATTRPTIGASSADPSGIMPGEWGVESELVGERPTQSVHAQLARAGERIEALDYEVRALREDLDAASRDMFALLRRLSDPLEGFLQRASSRLAATPREGVDLPQQHAISVELGELVPAVIEQGKLVQDLMENRNMDDSSIQVRIVELCEAVRALQSNFERERGISSADEQVDVVPDLSQAVQDLQTTLHSTHNDAVQQLKDTVINSAQESHARITELGQAVQLLHSNTGLSQDMLINSAQDLRGSTGPAPHVRGAGENRGADAGAPEEVIGSEFADLRKELASLREELSSVQCMQERTEATQDVMPDLSQAVQDLQATFHSTQNDAVQQLKDMVINSAQESQARIRELDQAVQLLHGNTGLSQDVLINSTQDPHAGAGHAFRACGAGEGRSADGTPVIEAEFAGLRRELASLREEVSRVQCMQERTEATQDLVPDLSQAVQDLQATLHSTHNDAVQQLKDMVTNSAQESHARIRELDQAVQLLHSNTGLSQDVLINSAQDPHAGASRALRACSAGEGRGADAGAPEEVIGAEIVDLRMQLASLREELSSVQSVQERMEAMQDGIRQTVAALDTRSPTHTPQVAMGHVVTFAATKEGPDLFAVDACQAPRPPDVHTIEQLRLRVVAAFNLRNRDSGLFGDVSDPYVLARIGQTVYQTLTIKNDLNPKWDAATEFVFSVGAEDSELDMEVMNANSVLSDNTLGKVSVAFRNLPPLEWTRRREKLTGATTGELEYEVLFEPVQAQQAMTHQARLGVRGAVATADGAAAGKARARGGDSLQLRHELQHSRQTLDDHCEELGRLCKIGGEQQFSKTRDAIEEIQAAKMKDQRPTISAYSTTKELGFPESMASVQGLVDREAFVRASTRARKMAEEFGLRDGNIKGVVKALKA